MRWAVDCCSMADGFRQQLTFPSILRFVSFPFLAPLPLSTPFSFQNLRITGNLIIKENPFLPHLGAFYPAVDGFIKVFNNPTMKPAAMSGSYP